MIFMDPIGRLRLPSRVTRGSGGVSSRVTRESGGASPSRVDIKGGAKAALQGDEGENVSS